MPESVTIEGREVEISWTVGAQRNLRIRASKAGLEPDSLLLDFRKPRKAEFAVTAMLWLLLPDAEYRKYETPENLFGVLSDDHAERRVAAILEVLASAAVDSEKKNGRQNERLRGSNSASQVMNGT